MWWRQGLAILYTNSLTISKVHLFKNYAICSYTRAVCQTSISHMLRNRLSKIRAEWISVFLIIWTFVGEDHHAVACTLGNLLLRLCRRPFQRPVQTLTGTDIHKKNSKGSPTRKFEAQIYRLIQGCWLWRSTAPFLRCITYKYPDDWLCHWTHLFWRSKISFPSSMLGHSFVSYEPW